MKKYFFIVCILGIINHFLYDWSGNSALAALFCPINESPWEHLKLLFFPFLLVSLLMYRRYHPVSSKFFYSQFLGVLAGMLSIIILYFTYTGVFGQDSIIVDLSIYFFSVWLSFHISQYLYKKKFPAPSRTFICILWLITSLLFFVYTCYPPNIPLFFPPM